MDIRPIRTEEDYREALAKVEGLWDSAEPGTPEGDELDVTVTLIQAYEREHYPIPPPDPIEAIKFRIEQLGIGRKGLEGIIGSRARVAEVLAGTRALSIAMIRRLNRELDIPADILIREVQRSLPTRTSAAPAQKKAPRAASRAVARSKHKSERPQRPVPHKKAHDGRAA